MVYGNIEDQKKAITAQAGRLRRATGVIRRLKPVILSYDGKIYNKRFDESIRNLSDDAGHLSCYNRYGWFYIDFMEHRRYNNHITILSCYGCTADQIEHKTNQDRIVFDGKRIKADRMVSLLDLSYCELLKKAYELETAAQELENTLKQIKDTHALLNHLVDSVPDYVRDVCGIKRFY